MSSLRLALKQSLQEAGGDDDDDSPRRLQKPKKKRGRPPKRQPGDPPRKRGRPRKHPLPEQEPEPQPPKQQEASSDENEFSDDDEKLPAQQKSPPVIETKSSGGGGLFESSSSSEEESDDDQQQQQDDDDQEEQQSAKSKSREQNSAANKIQSHWKQKNVEKQQARKVRSPKAAKKSDDSEAASKPADSGSNKKSGKSTHVPGPSDEIMEWIGGLSVKKQRRNMVAGLRVKVRFSTKVKKRDGKVVKKLKWYGGLVTAVSTGGSKLRIKYDDATSEVTKFPDNDMFVDDTDNGTHRADASVFCPPPPEMSDNDQEEQEFVEEPEPVEQEPSHDVETDPHERKKKKKKKRKLLALKSAKSSEEADEEKDEKHDAKAPSPAPKEDEEEKRRVSKKKRASQSLHRITSESREEDAKDGESTKKAEASEAPTETKDEATVAKSSKLHIHLVNPEKAVVSAPVDEEQEKDVDAMDVEQDESKEVVDGMGTNDDAQGGGEETVERQDRSPKPKKKKKKKKRVLADSEDDEESRARKVAKVVPDDSNEQDDAAAAANEAVLSDKVETGDTTVAEQSAGDKEHAGAVASDADKDTDNEAGAEPSSKTQKRKREESDVEKSPEAAPKVTNRTESPVPASSGLETSESKEVDTTMADEADEKGDGPAEEDAASLESSKDSAFDKKGNRKYKRRKETSDLMADAEKFGTPINYDRVTDLESLSIPRSGRRAAQQANERIASKQELIHHDPFAKPKKKREKNVPKEKQRRKDDDSNESEDDHNWVQCDLCSKWRVIPGTVDTDTLPKHWYCEMNTFDPLHNSCDAPEQTAQEVAKAKRKEKKRLARLARLEAAAGNEASAEEGSGKSKLKRASSTADEAGQSDSGSESQKAGTKKPSLKRRKSNESDGAATETSKGKSGRGRQRRGGKGNKGGDTDADPDNQEWVQCEKCHKWRRLAPHVTADELPDVWYCKMNSWDPRFARCDAEEAKADPTHREFTIIGGATGGGSKLSYRNLIFGTAGRKQNRPVSERMRAAESLFAFDPDDVSSDVGYPTVLYAKSSMFANRSSRSQEDKKGEMPFLEMMNRSNLWAELRGLSQLLPSTGHIKPIAHYSTPMDMAEMKEMVYHALGERELAANEVLLEVQCGRWVGVSRKWSQLRAMCTAESVSAALLGLMKEGRIEVTQAKVFAGEGALSKFKRAVRTQSVSSLTPKPKQSRCMKIAKPWKHKQHADTEETTCN